MELVKPYVFLSQLKIPRKQSCQVPLTVLPEVCPDCPNSHMHAGASVLTLDCPEYWTYCKPLLTQSMYNIGDVYI